MTRQSSLQSIDTRIHPAECRCRRCAPVRLSGDNRNFAKRLQGHATVPQGWGRWLPDAPAATVMLFIGVPALITHIILFS